LTDVELELRQEVDAVIAEANGELSHREIAEVLLEARDTLLVHGHVPDWSGTEDAATYQCMVRE
jgi:3-deoxy-D-manno-octulosonate 8-phosphate phosphatase KdsC-like HAD superfamily phosphatase